MFENESNSSIELILLKCLSKPVHENEKKLMEDEWIEIKSLVHYPIEKVSLFLLVLFIEVEFDKQFDEYFDVRSRVKDESSMKILVEVYSQ